MNLRNELDKLERELDTMDTNDPRFDELNNKADEIQEQLNAIEDAYLKEQAARIAKRHLEDTKKRIMDKHPEFDNFETWYQFVRSKYDYDADFKVTSTTRNWSEDNPKEWYCGTQAEALEKIEQLINWREYDHFKRDK